MIQVWWLAMEFCSWVPSWPFGAHSISPAALGSNWKNTRRVYVSKIPKSLDVQSSTDAQEPIQTEVGGTGTLYRVVKQDWSYVMSVYWAILKLVLSPCIWSNPNKISLFIGASNAVLDKAYPLTLEKLERYFQNENEGYSLILESTKKRNWPKNIFTKSRKIKII